VVEFNSLDSFTTGTSDLTNDGTAVLAQIAALLSNTTDAIQIQGHTDSEDELLDNLRLSQERADSVAAVLVDEGIDQSRIIALGFGENEPVASNDSDEGTAENSRIEFVITP
jgi:outer membrane protein OmpA-like peptidoglycan-associated protein